MSRAASKFTSYKNFKKKLLEIPREAPATALSAESVVDEWIRFLLDEVSCQWIKVILLNSSRLDPQWS